jgi:hypothetical protein
MDYEGGLSIATLQANGVQFVCRYLSDGLPKDITKQELDSLLGAGIAVVLNWETNGQTPSSAQGAADARAAQQEAATLGLGDAVIYFSADFDPTDKTDEINAYMTGVASVLGKERTGLYSGYAGIQAYFDAGIGDYGWQTYAWSSGQWDTRAQLQQWNNSVVWDGTQVDQDRATTTDYGQNPQAIEDLDMSTQSSNGTASISFRTGSVSTLQITTDSPPLELRVVLSLQAGPWVQNGTGGTGVNASLYTVGNGFATYTLDGSHVSSCGGVTLEAQGAGSTGKIFSVTGF